MARRYTPEQRAWMEANWRSLTNAEAHARNNRALMNALEALEDAGGGSSIANMDDVREYAARLREIFRERYDEAEHRCPCCGQRLDGDASSKDGDGASWR